MGYNTTLNLLQACPSNTKTDEVAAQMKQEKWVVKSWVSMADLLRIDGIDRQFAELLYFSGIHSVQRLALFNAENLTKKMQRINEQEHRVEVAPDVTAVTQWIAIAKTLENIIEF